MNVICKYKYKCARESYLRWSNNGKIRHSELYDEMVNSRKVFIIKALRYCKFNKERISNVILASSFRGKKADLFWKEVRERQPWNKIKNNEIDGLTDNDDVARLFHDKFKTVTGSVSDYVPECEGFRGNASF